MFYILFNIICTIIFIINSIKPGCYWVGCSHYQSCSDLADVAGKMANTLGNKYQLINLGMI